MTITGLLSLALLLIGFFCMPLHAAPREEERGEVAFSPSSAESSVPSRFRMAANHFPWQAKRMQTVSATLEVWDVTFPSPVTTSIEANNTVHAEYYRSRLSSRRPAVVVLHILGGDFELSRLFANCLAQHGVHSLFVKMPYYGPRRDMSSTKRMVSPDPDETVAGMTQAVFDIRRSVAWLANRPEIDPKQLGIFGISLGGITAALVAAVEPRVQHVCLLLAGGDIGAAGWDAPHAKVIRERWLAQGRTRDEFATILKDVDPVTYAQTARGKRILMLNATDDEIIPRACTVALWKSLGEPEIRWLDGGHISVMRHLFSALLTVSHFFAADARQAAGK